MLRTTKNGYPLLVKSLRSLALLIVQQRSSSSHVPASSAVAKPPGPSWSRSFYKRHPEVRARGLKPVDCKRHDYNIRSKVEEWFSVIGPELHNPVTDPVNVYNMDETGVMLSVPNLLKVLVGKDDYRNSRGARVKRTLVTAI
ncbi:hypothetical protein BGW36DRAFT_375389 [Talaromyces proteolyticus]|uniref:DDE-1 domain-containing protein n=1 Tax=Talaromyces proteolyticus TaxID=1131652 RepID=A0AAD4L021_9EURO|nr:uncharacterized protein BGW36DRAFT_375389 [Talaromyces proteolyticus]KAH8701010.1 hypothetical protein BGW36DRAFT_375389 [Talaromyces proteolyticus]